MLNNCNVKKLLYFLLLLLPILSFAQSRYGVEGVPVCWRTPLGVDSSLNRYVIISSTGKPVQTIVYENANGVVVNVSGGSMRYGYCDCIDFTVPDSSVTWEMLTQPVKDSIKHKRDTFITVPPSTNYFQNNIDNPAKFYNNIYLSCKGRTDTSIVVFLAAPVFEEQKGVVYHIKNDSGLVAAFVINYSHLSNNKRFYLLKRGQTAQVRLLPDAENGGNYGWAVNVVWDSIFTIDLDGENRIPFTDSTTGRLRTDTILRYEIESFPAESRPVEHWLRAEYLNLRSGLNIPAAIKFGKRYNKYGTFNVDYDLRPGLEGFLFWRQSGAGEGNPGVWYNWMRTDTSLFTTFGVAGRTTYGGFRLRYNTAQSVFRISGYDISNIGAQGNILEIDHTAPYTLRHKVDSLGNWYFHKLDSAAIANNEFLVRDRTTSKLGRIGMNAFVQNLFDPNRVVTTIGGVAVTDDGLLYTANNLTVGDGSLLPTIKAVGSGNFPGRFRIEDSGNSPNSIQFLYDNRTNPGIGFYYIVNSSYSHLKLPVHNSTFKTILIGNVFGTDATTRATAVRVQDTRFEVGASSQFWIDSIGRIYGKYLLPSAPPELSPGAISTAIWTNGVSSFIRSQHAVITNTTDGFGDLVITFPASMPDSTYTIISQSEGTTPYILSAHTKATGSVKVRVFDAAGIAVTSTSVTVSYEVKDY